MSAMELVGITMTTLVGLLMICGGGIAAWVCICFHGKLKSDGVVSMMFMIAGFICILSAFAGVAL